MLNDSLLRMDQILQELSEMSKRVEKIKGDESVVAISFKTAVLLSEFITHYSTINKTREAFMLNYKNVNLQVYPSSCVGKDELYFGKRSEILKLIGYENNDAN